MSGVRIKLCGVRSARDAELCARAGADEIGVVFAPRSRRCVTVKTAREIHAALGADARLVGVFQDVDLADALRVAAEVGLSAVQLHGKLPAATGTLPLYAALQVDGEPALSRLAALQGFRRVLLDGPAGGGGGVSFAWSLARKARQLFASEVYIGGGLAPENVAQAIRAARPDGVDVASGIERPDGFKDEGRVRDFVAAARAAAREIA
ncbi:MAG: phosphoribosylanthranilate isomerase [Myxococcales bacterium]